MKTSLLREIGLTRGEALVYEALLKTGETTVGSILEESGISAGKVYQILDRLEKKGLASHIIKEKTKWFSAASPNELIRYIERKENELEVQKKDVKAVLPELMALYQADEPTHETRMFTGYKGLRTAVTESLSEFKGKEVCAMGLVSEKDEYVKALWKHWHTERIQRKISGRFLFSDKAHDWLKKQNYTQVRVLSGITPSAVLIIGDEVLIQTYDPISCLRVRDEHIAQSFQTFFEGLWNSK